MKKTFWIAELTKLGAEDQFPRSKTFSGRPLVHASLTQVVKSSTSDLHLPAKLVAQNCRALSSENCPKMQCPGQSCLDLIQDLSGSPHAQGRGKPTWD